MANVAAVDCGSLSTRLLISDGSARPVLRLMRITGLGEGVDEARRLRPDAMERALSALRGYREAMDRNQVGAVRMVGTSALRDATNRDTFVRAAAAAVGAPLELLSGEDEAALSLLGATSDLPQGSGPWLVVDIGGGSTELAVGPGPAEAVSLDLGCVRVTERFLHHDPPLSAELAEATQWLVGQLGLAVARAPALTTARVLVGLAGTVSALALFAQGLRDYERDRVHHFHLGRRVVENALAQLAARPVSERAGLPGIEPARAPHVVGGALVLAAVMAYFGHPECLVSEADILDGLVLSLLPPGGQPR